MKFKLFIFKKLNVVFIFMLFYTSFLFSQNNIFIERYSARAIGMGNVFTSIADDSTAIFYNPAGVGQFGDKTLFNSMYANVHNLGLFHNYILSASTKYNEDIGMGGAWVYERIDLEPEIWNQHRFFYSASYSLKEYIYIGVTGKLIYINTGFNNYDKVWGCGFDTGLLLSSEEWGISFFDKNDIVLRTGLLLRNFYSTIKWDDQNKERLPLQIAIGGHISYNEIINAGVLFKGVDDNITGLALGIEFFLLKTIGYQFDEMLKINDIVLRAGMEREKIVSSATSLSFGMGLIGIKFSFDYAIRIQPDYFTPTHYFSLNVSM